MRQIGLLFALLALLPVFAGCGPTNGELASPPLGVVYRTGDSGHTISGQMGLGDGGPGARVTETEGRLGFAGDAEVSCGPQDGDFRLRFVPRDSSSPVLSLYLAQGEGHAGPTHGAETHAAEGTSARAVVQRIENGRLVELTGTAQVSLHPSTHSAGRHAVSGTFTAEVGGARLEGELDDCYYFTG